MRLPDQPFLPQPDTLGDHRADLLIRQPGTLRLAELQPQAHAKLALFMNKVRQPLGDETNSSP